jgi:hypothetical protein
MVMCVTVAALLAAFPSSSATAAGTKLQGKVTWTTTATTATDTPGGDAVNSRETRTVTLRVKMTKRAGAAGWQPQDNGSKYTGAYRLSSMRVERDSDAQPTCTTTHEAVGNAGGPLPRRPRSTTAPALFGDVVPSTASLGARTKALILRPILRYKGKDSTGSTGAGQNPCQDGQDVDVIEGSLAPTDSANRVCYPAGTSKRTTPPQAGTLIGAWKAKTRRFSFACSDSWREPEGVTIEMKVTGSLRLT